MPAAATAESTHAVAWGWNFYGQLGNGMNDDAQPTPVEVGAVTGLGLIPPEWAFADYANPLMADWNWSFRLTAAQEEVRASGSVQP